MIIVSELNPDRFCVTKQNYLDLWFTGVLNDLPVCYVFNWSILGLTDMLIGLLVF